MKENLIKYTCNICKKELIIFSERFSGLNPTGWMEIRYKNQFNGPYIDGKDTVMVLPEICQICSVRCLEIYTKIIKNDN